MFFKKNKSSTVAEHYNSLSDYYLKHYGNVIQAHRTTDIVSLLDYLADKMQLRNNMNILDLGCGYCGPAIYFAKQFNICLTCITNSKVQFDVALKKIAESGLTDRIKILCRDYHNINHLPEADFDLAFFLESFGHSYNWKKLLKSVHSRLRTEGKLFIKDYFAVDFKNTEDRKTREAIKESLQNISKHYKYQAIDKHKLLKELQKSGFTIISDTLPGYELDNTKVVNGFEKELGIRIYASDNFMPLNVNACEILCRK